MTSGNLQAGRTGADNRQRPTGRGGDSPEPSVSTADLLELLGDEYTREVLAAVSETARSGREVAETTSVSKPTAFRRLNRLADAGLVTTEMVVDTGGHHHKEYRAVVDSVAVDFGPDGMSVDVDREETATKARRAMTVPADD